MSEDRGVGSPFTDRWFPVARSEELVTRHIAQTQLLDQEIALWRDDAGLVNAWENRCPHRGVRLSIGFNTGAELRCRYHGWRFATGSGRCTTIPAHPDQRPSNAIKATPYACIERHGFAWVSLGGSPGAPKLPELGLETGMTLRSVFVEAPPSRVEEQLSHAFAPAAVRRAPFIYAVEDQIVLLLQPVTAGQCVIYGILLQAVAPEARLSTLRRCNAQLTALRDKIESRSDD